jgi:uncharacterized membrane protein YhhN
MFEHLFDRNDTFDTWRLVIAGTSLTVSVIYLAFAGRPSSPLRTTLKTAAIGTLALLPWTYLGTTGANPLFILSLALALSALGDFFLALKDQQRFFLYGLGTFLAAHVAYLAAFLPHAQMPAGGALIAVIATLAAASAFLIVLAPRLGKMKLPVIAYFAIIMAMAAAAWSIPNASWMLGAGAAIFALSDSLIAQRKFLNPFPGHHIAVWITYVAAQFMMTAAFLHFIVP